MPDQIPVSEKERRARELIALGNHVARRYMESWLQRETTLLPEERINGCWEGYTPEYIRVTLSPEADCQSGRIIPVRLTGISPEGMLAEPSEAAPPMK